MYKIRNAEGLFSTGGGRPQWTKKGKAWSGRGHVTNHLRQVSSTNTHNPPYDGSEEIIEYELVVRSVISVEEHLDERNKIKAVKDAKDAARNKKDELERLKKKKAQLQVELDTLASKIGDVAV